MLHIFDFQKELFRKYGEIRFFDPGGVENIDDLLVYQCVIDYLLDGSLDFFVGRSR